MCYTVYQELHSSIKQAKLYRPVKTAIPCLADCAKTCSNLAHTCRHCRLQVLLLPTCANPLYVFQDAPDSTAGTSTLFATHFTQLAQLGAIYPNCKLWHFDVGATPEAQRLDYTWKLKPGQQQSMHYGLILAHSVGIPQQVCRKTTLLSI